MLPPGERRGFGLSTARRLCLGMIVVAALGASGCGGGSSGTHASRAGPPGSWSDEVCTEVAGGVARYGAQALLHFRPPLSNYPPDVALLGVRLAVGGLESHHCPPAIAGRVLSRRLTPGQRAELFTHLPPGDVRYLRRGLQGP